MKNKLMFLMSMAMIFGLVGVVGIARAALITFDDYYPPPPPYGFPGYIEIGDHYHEEYGITFDQAYAVYYWNQDHVERQYPGDVAAVPYGGSSSTRYDSSIFTFDYVLKSFELLGDAFDDTLYLDAYDNNDNLVKSYSQYLENGNWYTMSIDLTDVSATKIVIHTNGASFGFNDMRFEAVPIPSTVLLLVFGLVGLVGIRRKFRKS